ncbi:septation protein SepH [Serinicoccus sp. LYQ131]|uniref:septation protein SepH n=1 Tax=Serinicoccus sp. LYQ131 TaxID=3378797 RepID=UPI00385249AC
MQQLQFVELDEGGRLVLADEDGTQYALPVDDRLRASLRPRRGNPFSKDGRTTVSPRDVQAMIRAGQPAEDVATSTGWDLDRVRRFEGPVLAEREHLVGLAQRAPVRASGRTDGSHTLDRRVQERLQSRGVDLTAVSWDAARGEAHGPWTVIVAFAAGGRERRAAWHYDVRSRSLESLDDEARWLSEDEQALPGGLAGHPLLGTSHGEDEAAADLMATMRERRQRRGRRSQSSARRTDDPTHVPGQQQMPDEVLPLEELSYDPGTMGDPPAAHPRDPALMPEGAEEAPETETETEAAVEAEIRVVETETETVAPVEPPSPEEAQRAVGRSPGRKRRGLRLPKVGAVPEPERDEEPEPVFARVHHDPNEVTFDEFFGTDEGDEDDEAAPDVARGDTAADDSAAGDAIANESEESDADAAPEPMDADGPVGVALVDEIEEADEESDPDEAPADEPEADEPEADEDDEADSDEDDAPDDEASPEQPPAREAEESRPSKKGRTSVPSWDDIMFGSRDRR